LDFAQAAAESQKIFDNVLLSLGAKARLRESCENIYGQWPERRGKERRALEMYACRTRTRFLQGQFEEASACVAAGTANTLMIGLVNSISRL